MPRRVLPPSLTALALIAIAPAQGDAAAAAATKRFVNRNASFHVELPDGWRQIAPNEARTVAENPLSPPKLGFAQPQHFYAVGPVERWLAGDFTGAWVYVVEQESEWYVAETWQEDLRAMWDAEGKASGATHRIERCERTTVGSQQVDALVAVRLTTPADGRLPTKSLDVHVPSGGRQLSMSFTCPPERFEAELPGFQRALATLTFARVAKAQTTLGERLWTPMLVGAGVGVVLLLLYRHTRGRR
jgi:hypothetical protein